jgi:CDP-alcohol phosphatidyltransferase
VKQANGLALKGQAVEEWIDVHFFRPAGLRVARTLLPTRVTPDQVTLMCLFIGLAAGHLMIYRSPLVNGAGVGLFIISDIFDSADGQLARLRGRSTRLGRILDGISDTGRFLNLYLHLMARLILEGWGWRAVLLVVAAGLSHVFQSAAADFVRHAFLEGAVGEGAELDLPDDSNTRPTGGFWRRVAIRAYRDYVARQAWMLRRSVALIRRIRALGASDEFRARYWNLQSAPLLSCGLIGQNIRFLLLAITVVPGWTAGFFWLTVLPLNLVLFILLAVHEHRATRLLAEFTSPVGVGAA